MWRFFNRKKAEGFIIIIIIVIIMLMIIRHYSDWDSDKMSFWHILVCAWLCVVWCVSWNWSCCSLVHVSSKCLSKLHLIGYLRCVAVVIYWHAGYIRSYHPSNLYVTKTNHKCEHTNRISISLTYLMCLVFRRNFFIFNFIFFVAVWTCVSVCVCIFFLFLSLDHS